VGENEKNKANQQFVVVQLGFQVALYNFNVKGGVAA
jgi:hypothetical protein